MIDDIEVAIIGGGAAGVGAARVLKDAGVPHLIIEARARLGGRAWTVQDASGHALDLGCGWLHSADRNPWTTIAPKEGFAIDKTAAPWRKRARQVGFPLAEQEEFGEALDAFHERVSEAAKKSPDRAMSTVLDPNSRWNGLINAVNTYISGAEVERVSNLDFDRYEDTAENWRVTGGYGALIAKYGATSPVVFDCPVERIDRSGKRLRIQTANGTITADRVIVTLPSSILAQSEELFSPALPDKTGAARGLPLGLADKLFLSLEGAEEFDKDTRVFGHIDRVATAGYSLRPFGWPMIECYFGGELAATLEQRGERAFFDFAASELVGVLGGNFAKRIKPVAHHGWLLDPFARGSYSYAVPGQADQRAVLAAPVDNRIFFAGEATSEHDFSTAHGALLTGQRAAREAIAAR